MQIYLKDTSLFVYCAFNINSIEPSLAVLWGTDVKSTLDWSCPSNLWEADALPSSFGLCLTDNMQENRVSRWYFGGVSASAAACFTHPLDLIKVNYKANWLLILINTVAQFFPLGNKENDPVRPHSSVWGVFYMYLWIALWKMLIKLYSLSVYCCPFMCWHWFWE